MATSNFRGDFGQLILAFVALVSLWGLHEPCVTCAYGCTPSYLQDPPWPLALYPANSAQHPLAFILQHLLSSSALPGVNRTARGSPFSDLTYFL